MDPPFMAFANICIFGVILMLFASTVDSTEEWQQQPVIPQPIQPNPLPQPQQNLFPPPPPQQNLLPPPQNNNLQPGVPPPSKSAPPPKSSRSNQKNPPSQAPSPSLHASPPSATPPNGRPFVSAPSPIQAEQNHPPIRRTGNDMRNDLGKKIGLLFLGVILIMQVIIVIFLIIKRRQLFNPDNVY